MPRARSQAADEAEGGTFFLHILGLSVFCAYRRGCQIQGAQEPAAMLRLGFLEGDGESGFYHVEAVTETSKGFHEHPHAVVTYWPSWGDHRLCHRHMTLRIEMARKVLAGLAGSRRPGWRPLPDVSGGAPVFKIEKS